MLPLFLIVVFSLIYLKIANRFNIIDKPNFRSSHTTPTIRGGGILFWLAIIVFFFINNFQYPYFVVGVSLIAIVSFIDDVITLNSNVRLPFQFLAISFCMLQVGFKMEVYILIIPVLIVGVGFINIYNFMDGINGMTGFYSIVVLLSFFFINLKENIIDDNLIIYLLLSLFVFGFYNFRKKARMFAGDIGSISVAVLLFFIGTCFIKELKSPILLLFILVYGTDAILTLVYRKFLGEKITTPHRKHVYQKLVHILKLSHLKTSFLYSLYQLVICFIVCFSYKFSIVSQLIIMFFCIVVSTIIYLLLFKLIEDEKKKNIRKI